MELRFDGKRALVTGGGKGIGRATVKALIESGAQTFTISRTQEDLASLKEECPGVHTVCLDIADYEATRAAVTAMGAIDLLVNNAGVGKCQPFLEIDHTTLERILDVNLKAVINVSQVVAKGMVERGKGGSIVNVSSQASKIALPEHVSYSASKAALDAVTRGMALELGPHQIRVNSVNPTVVLTELAKRWRDPVKAGPMLKRIPQGKFAEVKDVVHSILFLLSDKSDMINGHALMVDGGVLAC